MESLNHSKHPLPPSRISKFEKAMDEQRWEDLEMDCLVKVLEKVGMESLLLDAPFVCKSWYKAALNPSCWQSLIFPDNECMEVWPWDVSECPNFQNLMDRFASEYQIDGDRCSVSAFLKFVINRSSGNAIVLKLPKRCTVEPLNLLQMCKFSHFHLFNKTS
ncbi:F-BOX WITH WD-40 2 [Prunus dulcis]|uniref:F-BOX WITH WD-40 2 n=2 Tax=Prunus dulcis TaxID=3755 RepID=A0A4Y1QZS6_PRUDU|nr:F-BOX WITH WD-40 2 [Prunus dulcis]